MNIFWAVFLGIVQGLTEFLPVSSSGHLVLAQKLIPSFSQPGVLFDVILHFGTLFTVVYYFRKKIFSLSYTYLTLLIVGSIPAALFGFLFKDLLESTFSIGGIFLAFQFLITSLICYLSDRSEKGKKEIAIKDSFIIGSAQALSILPAISRSGLTIFAAIQRGIDRKEAAEFSFLLSIPAILGANLLEIASYRNEFSLQPFVFLLGFLTAFFTGILSIKLTISFLTQKKFKIFAYYTAFLALISLFV
jgi:undecaprenyl-diphosphatase